MMTAVTTRPFVIEDYDSAVALWRAVDGVEICEGDSREQIRDYLARNPGLSQVAEAAGEIVGALLCGHDGRRGYIYHLAVAAAFRGRGIGKMMLTECIPGLRKAGIERALILVEKNNAKGHAFWLRHGWEDIPALAMALDT